MRLTIVGRDGHFNRDVYNGFAPRHIQWVRWLTADPALVVSLVVFQSEVRREVESGLPEEIRVSIPLRPRTSRRARLAESGRLIAHVRGPADAVRLTQRVAGTLPDVVLTLGPWEEALYRGIFGRWPTVHAFEEDISLLPEFSSGSRQARVLTWMERVAGQLAAGQPKCVVTISEPEDDRALGRFKRSKVITVPFVLDDAWRRPVLDRRPRDEVVIVGVMSDERNARGLADLLRALRSEYARGESPLPIRLASGKGLHPCLAPYIDKNTYIDTSGRSGPDLYDGARVAVVPSAQATGVKTTILQAWARHVPVVTYESSAATVGASDGKACRVAQDGAQMATQLRRVWTEEALQRSLIEAGAARLTRDFSEDSARSRLYACLATAADAQASGQAR